MFLYIIDACDRFCILFFRVKMIATQAQNLTIENVWQNLLRDIEEIYNLRPITTERYMQLYK